MSSAHDRRLQPRASHRTRAAQQSPREPPAGVSSLHLRGAMGPVAARGPPAASMCCRARLGITQLAVPPLGARGSGANAVLAIAPAARPIGYRSCDGRPPKLPASPYHGHRAPGPLAEPRQGRSPTCSIDGPIISSPGRTDFGWLTRGRHARLQLTQSRAEPRPSDHRGRGLCVWHRTGPCAGTSGRTHGEDAAAPCRADAGQAPSSLAPMAQSTATRSTRPQAAQRAIEQRASSARGDKESVSRAMGVRAYLAARTQRRPSGVAAPSASRARSSQAPPCHARRA